MFVFLLNCKDFVAMWSVGRTVLQQARVKLYSHTWLGLETYFVRNTWENKASLQICQNLSLGLKSEQSKKWIWIWTDLHVASLVHIWGRNATSPLTFLFKVWPSVSDHNHKTIIPLYSGKLYVRGCSSWMQPGIHTLSPSPFAHSLLSHLEAIVFD